MARRLIVYLCMVSLSVIQGSAWAAELTVTGPTWLPKGGVGSYTIQWSGFPSYDVAIYPQATRSGVGYGIWQHHQRLTGGAASGSVTIDYTAPFEDLTLQVTAQAGGSVATSDPRTLVVGAGSSGEGSGGGAETGNTGLDVTVTVQGVAAPGYAITATGTAGTFSGTTDTGGQCKLHTAAGSYTVTATGQYSSSRPATVVQGSRTAVHFAFDNQGQDTGGGTGGGGGDLGSWLIDALAQLLYWLFVPRQHVVQELLGTASLFYDWGPFGIIGQVAGWKNNAPGTVGLALPVPTYQNGAWGPGGEVPVNLAVFSDRTDFQLLRSWMGYAVYAVWLAFVVRHLMPRQTL